MARELEIADPLSGLDPENVALFLDVDGTLLDIAPVPEAVKVPDGLGPALSVLHRSLNGALAIVSGRPIKQIDQLFKPLVLPASGEHGFEIRRIPHEKVERFQPPTALNLLRPSVTELARRMPGLIPEFKTSTIALHYRQVPQQANALREAIEMLLQDSPEFSVQTGKMVFEIKPRDVDKGRAISQLMMAPPFANRIPVFVGDDDTDEHGFAAVRKAGGRAIRVGAAHPAADTALPSPAHVRAWLMRLAEQMSSAAA
ncbi:MAG TPA: trehalose-phosphatase [Alphaproteobacteria bacterium]|nr:trehalose-phosphatase [Alphaproteobacteria bacterium]